MAQGIEAGGRVRGRVGLLALLDEVLGAVDVPVLAAGGTGSGRAMAAALAAGAEGVRVGTRFVAAAESDAHPAWVDRLVAARAEDTVYGRTFTAWWDAPGRVLRSSVEAAHLATTSRSPVGRIGGRCRQSARLVNEWGRLRVAAVAGARR